MTTEQLFILGVIGFAGTVIGIVIWIRENR